jgi:hypothetical protein
MATLLSYARRFRDELLGWEEMTMKPIAIILSAMVVLILAFYLIANIVPMYPEFPFHVQGQVFDKSTNAIVGAKVNVSGHMKVTGSTICFPFLQKNFILKRRRMRMGSLISALLPPLLR